MLAGRAVDAAGAVGGGAAPDALVAAGTVAVLARRGVDAARAVACATAVSAFCTHSFFPPTMACRQYNKITAGAVRLKAIMWQEFDSKNRVIAANVTSTIR